MKQRIIHMIEEYSEDGDFTGRILDIKVIDDIKKKMRMDLPSQYEWFIRNYGQGGIGGVQVLGISKVNRAVFWDVTKEYRKYGLPNNLLVIENCNEWLYCIDVNTEKVVKWDMIGGVISERYRTFLDFLVDRFNDEIENI